MKQIILGLIQVLMTVSVAEDGFIETDAPDPDESRIIIIENKMIFIADISI